MNIFINVYRNVGAICGAYEMNEKNGEMYAKCGFSSASNKTSQSVKRKTAKKREERKKAAEEEKEEGKKIRHGCIVQDFDF